MIAHTATHNLTLTSRLPEINTAIEFVTNYCNQHKLAKHNEAILALIIEELIANTVNHGCAPASAHIEIELQASGNDTIIVYRDRGVPFDPTVQSSEHELSSDSARIGGYGWPLIRYYCSSITYARKHEENYCTLTVRHR